MTLKITEIPSFQEFFGIENNPITSDEWYYTHKDDDIETLINLLLVLLQEFYDNHGMETESYYNSNQFKNDIDSFNTSLKERINEYFNEYFGTIEREYNSEYSIPDGTVNSKIDLKDVLNSGVDGLTDKLYNDIKHKSIVYENLPMVIGVFSVYADFRRAIRKLTDLVKNNAEHSAKVIPRKYLEFIYGEDALFDWICSGRNTCGWCYMIEASSPLPLSQLPIDHYNGGCTVKPHNPTEYSAEYKKLIEGSIR